MTTRTKEKTQNTDTLKIAIGEPIRSLIANSRTPNQDDASLTARLFSADCGYQHFEGYDHPSALLNRSIERYRAIQASEFPLLSEVTWALILDTFPSSAPLSIDTIRNLDSVVLDHLQESYLGDPQYMNFPTEELENLSLPQKTAVGNVVELFWGGKNQEMSIRQAISAVSESNECYVFLNDQSPDDHWLLTDFAWTVAGETARIGFQHSRVPNTFATASIEVLDRGVSVVFRTPAPIGSLNLGPHSLGGTPQDHSGDIITSRVLEELDAL